MRRKLSVTTPYGIVTRTTARDYQFVVVSMGQNEAYLRSAHEAGVAYATKKAAEYRAKAAAGGVLYPWAKPGDTPETCGQTAADFTKWAEDNEAATAKAFVMPEDHLVVHGWSGSQRGAASMVATAQKYGYTGILVVPVAAEVA